MKKSNRIKALVPGRPSLGSILGGLALMVALGGSAAANLPGTQTVNSGDIKNDNVKAVDLKDGSVKDAELGTIVVRTATTALNDGASGRATATCNAGERIIGGGGEPQQQVSDFISQGTHPSDGGGVRTASGNSFTHWNTKGTNVAGTTATIDLISYAICLQ
ncbi:MAG: hypothetical protein FJW90_04765 [Actinobacteria bacterium]|nr:hypothetical protein [Actinomycetota bacterium]